MNKKFRTPLLRFRSDDLRSASVLGDPKQTRRRKRAGIFAVITALTMCGAEVGAQQKEKIFRIGYLDAGTASGRAILVDALRDELTKLGWIEGKNITIEYRFADQNRKFIPELVADLVRLKVDLIVVPGTNSAIAVKNVTTAVPIVMPNAGDPVAAGLVASLARPKGNVTGFSALSSELNTKRLEILKNVLTKLTRVGVFRPAGASLVQDLQLKELRAAALALKVELEEIETEPVARDITGAFQTAKEKHVAAVMTTSNPCVFAARKQIVELAEKHRLPASYPQKEFVDDGGLMFYGADFADLFRKSAHYVDKILKGAKPADLPVQQATKFEFVANLKAAKQIGLTIPPNVLARADRVIR